MARVQGIRREPLQHVFSWAVKLEPMQDLALKFDHEHNRPGVAFEAGRNTFTPFGCAMILESVACSRPDFVVTADLVHERRVFGGPWLLNGIDIASFVITSHQTVRALVKSLAPETVIATVWWRVSFLR